MKSKSEKLREASEELRVVNEQIAKLKRRKRELESEIDSLKACLETQSEEIKQTFDNDHFEWSEKVQRMLREVFGIERFRSLQKVCINTTLSNKDCILVMPTGGGKSLCFQLPAVINDGITLVVSPLISLMEDQFMQLTKLNIKTAMFNNQSSKEESNQLMHNLVDAKTGLKILYVTPEKLAKSKRLMSQIEKVYKAGRFARIVIDEVHCCSQWGHDFRPDYKSLHIMKTQFPGTPILGLTATATTAVIKDIQKILNIEGCLVLKDSFFRPNLKYFIQQSSSKDSEELIKLIKEKFRNQCGIVYCMTIKETEEVSTQMCCKKIKASPYHAKLSSEDRNYIHQEWYKNNIHVIVATIAFGMGINKLDVRFVIHYTMSKSIENYYQETGRAGRDGKEAQCILFYRFSDTFKMTSFFYTERNALFNMYHMLRFCVDFKTCRKQYLAEYFEDDMKPACPQMCDNCQNKDKALNTIDVKNYCVQLLKIIENAAKKKERLTALKLIEAWLQKGDKKLRIPDIEPPSLTRSQCELIIIYLLLDDYLKEDFHFTAYSTISYIVSGHKAALINSKKSIEYDFPFVDKNYIIKSVKKRKNSEEPTSTKKSKSNDIEEVTLD
ncbi:ATP-dependent DNA helicase Q1-like protein [Dinothrombium tinctorium]|uniref:ATP-dependent DNA helicase n=1 Tax=Dinothrombium tinctorium TaxID=1965070 RepID=A0A443QGJ1_9ACAR|nr:ATP-dependent DNA helicase Q1-like protein [Dinothrombium tinctorium]